MGFDSDTRLPPRHAAPDLVSTPGGVAARRRHARRARAGRARRRTRCARRRRRSGCRRRSRARRAGTQLAENLERAAELAAVPDDLLLAVYTALRPGRATAAELEEWAARLDELRRASDRRVRAGGCGGLRGAGAARAMASRRFASRAERELHREQLVSPLPELGLVAADGPNDPEPELVVEDGVVTRMDGRARRRVRRHRPLRRRARPRSRRGRARRWRSTTSSSRACSST